MQFTGGFTVTGGATFIPPPPPQYALYSWGSSNNGQLGLNNTTNQSSPSQVGTGIDWSLVSSGFYTSAGIKTDGTLWSWGRNSNGELGLGNTINRSSPVQVGSAANWASVSVAASSTYPTFTLAVKTDGTLWVWGYNNFGNLGLSDYAYRSSPTQVGSATNWNKVTAGEAFSFAIKTNGTLWSWGRNSNGQLGLNTADSVFSPTQVGASTDWANVSAGVAGTAAIKTTGTLWSWGKNNWGNLGLNDGVLNRSSPTQIGSNNNWSLVGVNSYSTTAIRTDGTLWTWGQNNNGVLGLNQTGNYLARSSPTQVGGDTTWSQISMGRYAVGAIKTDNTLWTWGFGTFGTLGLNAQSSKSSPTQVGSSTNWNKVSMGVYGGLAITK